MAKNSFIQILDTVNTAINSYTEETSHEARERVIDSASGRKGIIVSYNTKDPSGKEKGEGVIVQWLVVGGQDWFPKTELEKVNGRIKKVDPEMLDYFLTLYH